MTRFADLVHVSVFTKVYTPDAVHSPSSSLWLRSWTLTQGRSGLVFTLIATCVLSSVVLANEEGMTLIQFVKGEQVRGREKNCSKLTINTLLVLTTFNI